MHQVRALAQQPFPFANRFPYEIDFAVLQVTQAAVNDAGGAAGGAGGEVVLLDQQGAAPGAGAFPRDGNTVNSAANDDDLKALAFERPPDWGAKFISRPGASLGRGTLLG